MARRHVRLELYTIHGHLDNDNPVDYVSLFGSMVALEGHHHVEGYRQVAIGRAALFSGRLFLVAYTGSSDRNILLFDVTARTELNESTPPGRFQARKTYAMIDPKLRLMLIAIGKGNLSHADLGQIIEDEAHKSTQFATLELAFTPVADTSFIAEIDSLSRIQAATVSLARPNTGWSDRYHQLTEVADESDAKAMDITVKAKRGKGLNRDAGLVGFVKAFITQPFSIFRRISIVGERGEDNGLITLNLSKHVEHTDLLLEMDATTGQVKDQDVREHMDAFLRSKEPPPQ